MMFPLSTGTERIRQSWGRLLFLALGCLYIPRMLAFHPSSIVPTPSTRPKTCIFSTTRTPENDEPSILRNILQKYGFQNRSLTLSTDQLTCDHDDGPITLVEIFRNGETELAILEGFEWGQIEAGDIRSFDEPKVRVSLPPNNGQRQEDDLIILDFGQVTTIWQEAIKIPTKGLNGSTIRQRASKVPDTVIERVFDRIHASTVRKGRKLKAPVLTKKLIPKEVEASFNQNDEFNPDMKVHAEQVLRKVQKVGSGFARLVDSSTVMEELFQKQIRQINQESPNTRNNQQLTVFRGISSMLLSQDALQGGRFKRWPCTLVEVNPGANSITLFNGGWVVLDQSVRAGLEAEKFVARKDEDVQTASDLRIKQRLECLAMGEIQDESNGVNLDVKRVLGDMELPCNPNGARQALVNMGQWSDDLSTAVQPWPKDILNAASLYSQVDQTKLVSKEDRVDLTNIPALCIDAKRTAFRDDAIGIRPRQSTGRKVNPQASKWELLIHIADVSDIYSDGSALSQTHGPEMKILEKAAEWRGTSRYDLPFGPLHLLPPSLLSSLGFSRRKESQRCVTIWVYIDERNGKILDSGIERTIIGKPIELSYVQASNLMNQTPYDCKVETEKNVRAILLAIERNLQSWSLRRQEKSESARKRETKMTHKSAQARNLQEFVDPKALDDMNEFQRTRAHRLVDTSLDLYGYVARGMAYRANAPLPSAKGAGLAQGGRVATAPLRRYIDGVCQRQLLAVLLNYGSPISEKECRRIGRIANDSRNQIAHNKASRKRVSR